MSFFMHVLLVQVFVLHLYCIQHYLLQSRFCALQVEGQLISQAAETLIYVSTSYTYV